MFQLTALYAHPSDPAAFDDHYSNTHIPLGAAIPGLRRFTVSRPGPDAEGNASPYHLVAVLEFTDAAAASAGMGSAEGQAAVADLANFAQAGVTIMQGESDVVV